MKLVKLVGALALLSATAAHADGKYVCTTSQTGFTENLMITGSGKTAKIRLMDVTMVADLTYNDQFTRELPQIGAPAGDWAFSGMATTRENPPTTAETVFILAPAIVSGGEGALLRFSDDSWLTFNCVPAER